MPLTKKDKALALQVKEILINKFGDLIAGIYCYGSRVTKNKSDSDFDVVILTNKKLDWKEQRKIKNEIYEIGIDSDIVFDPKVVEQKEFLEKNTIYPFYRSVTETGIFL